MANLARHRAGSTDGEAWLRYPEPLGFSSSQLPEPRAGRFRDRRRSTTFRLPAVHKEAFMQHAVATLDAASTHRNECDRAPQDVHAAYDGSNVLFRLLRLITWGPGL